MALLARHGFDYQNGKSIKKNEINFFPFNSYAQLSSLRVLSSCIGYNDLKCCKTFWIDQSRKLVRVYLQIEKGAINALTKFEKKIQLKLLSQLV